MVPEAQRGEDRSADRPKAFPWLVCVVLAGFNLLSYMDRQLFALLSLSLQRDLHIDDVQIGLLQGLAFSIIYVGCGLAAGWATDRFSRSKMVFAGVLIWSLATMSCGHANSFNQLFLSRSLVGLGEAVLAPAAYAILAEQTPPGRLGFAMSIYTIGASFGVVGALAGGGAAISAIPIGGVTVPLFGHLHPWQFAFVLLGAPGIFLAFFAFALPKRTARPSAGRSRPGEAEDQASFWRFLVTRRGALFCQQIGFAMLGLAGYAIVGWAPAFFDRSFGWSPAKAGPILGFAVGLGGLVGMLVFGAAADRRFRRGDDAAYFRTHMITTLCGVPLIVLAFLLHEPWLCVGLLVIGFPLLYSFGGSSSAALQLITPPALRGRAGALYLLTINVLGLGIGPLAVGTLTDKVFGSRQMVGASVAVTVAVSSALAVLCLTFGQKAYRQAVQLTRPGRGALTTMPASSIQLADRV